jgi:hypothetical protein
MQSAQDQVLGTALAGRLAAPLTIEAGHIGAARQGRPDRVIPYLIRIDRRLDTGLISLAAALLSSIAAVLPAPKVGRTKKSPLAEQA